MDGLGQHHCRPLVYIDFLAMALQGRPPMAEWAACSLFSIPSRNQGIEHARIISICFIIFQNVEIYWGCYQIKVNGRRFVVLSCHDFYPPLQTFPLISRIRHSSKQVHWSAMSGLQGLILERRTMYVLCILVSSFHSYAPLINRAISYGLTSIDMHICV